MSLEDMLARTHIMRFLENEYKDEKEKHAIRLLRNFYGNVPDNRTWIDFRGSLPSFQDFQKNAEYTENFFNYISELDLTPKDRKVLEKDYLKKIDCERKKTLTLYRKLGLDKPKPDPNDVIKERKRLRRMPNHRLPPYLYEWEGSLLGKKTPFYEYDGHMKDFKFTKKILGSGGFADVYLVVEPNGKKDALKLFHQSWKLFDPIGIMNPERLVENVKKKKDLIEGFSKFPKIRGYCVEETKYIPQGSYGYWYLMDFVKGKNGHKVLIQGNPSNEVKKSSLEGYAKTLNYLHSKDHVFMDNKWSSLMIDGDKTSMIDFDMITKCNERPPLNAATVLYATTINLERQSQPAVKDMDLAGFAKMIDHLYVGNPLTNDSKSIRKFEKIRVYPAKRKEKIPSGLNDVVEQVLIKPDSNIKISDFCSAIKEIEI